MTVPTPDEIRALLSNLDIYVFDQLLKGNITKGMKVLDAGCGEGRNVRYFMQAGLDVFGADLSEESILKLQEMASQLAPALPESNFVVADLATLPFSDFSFDVVLCSAVLHFAEDETHFKDMVVELVRVLKPGSLFFCRLSTTIGMEGKFNQVGERRYQMPHGPVWFLADKSLLLELENQLKMVRVEPLKTVLVEQERSMTTWVLRKK